MTDLFLARRRTRRRSGRAFRRCGLTLLASTALAPVGIVFMTASAGADLPHAGCSSVAAGQSSGWCGLYPGNASDNTQELGLVSVSADGTTLTVQTQDASTGVVPATSFACLTGTAPTLITHRLEQTLCASVGGVWFPYTGGSLTIDLAAYPQFLNAQFTVQVAANHDANNANGDAFYNNVSVSTVAGTPS
jgi:hypothetical protein